MAVTEGGSEERGMGKSRGRETQNRYSLRGEAILSRQEDVFCFILFNLGVRDRKGQLLLPENDED